MTRYRIIESNNIKCVRSGLRVVKRIPYISFRVESRRRHLDWGFEYAAASVSEAAAYVNDCKFGFGAWLRSAPID